MDGTFEAKDLKEGTYLLSLSESRLGLNHRSQVEIPNERELLLELSSSNVSGEVRSSVDGQGVPGADLQLLAMADDTLEGRQTFRRGSRIASDSAGHFNLGALTEGAWRLTVTKDGYAAVEKTLEVGPGTEDLELDILLAPVEALVIRVLGPDGTPPRQAAAAILSPDGKVVTAVSSAPDEQGRIELASAPAGTWRLLVNGDNSPTVEHRINAPGEVGPVTLPRGRPFSLPLRALLRTAAPWCA